jgi:hypothetical protein
MSEESANRKNTRKNYKKNVIIFLLFPKNIIRNVLSDAGLQKKHLT